MDQIAKILNNRSDRRLYAHIDEAREIVRQTVERAIIDGELAIIALDRLYERRPDIRRTWTGK